MAVTRVGISAFVSGTGAVTVTIPAGSAAGDMMVIGVETANQALPTPNYFDPGDVEDPWGRQEAGTGTGAAAGGTRLILFWKALTATEITAGTISVPDSGNHQCAFGVVYRDVSAVAAATLKTQTPAATAASTNTIASTNVTNGAMLVAVYATDRDNATASAVTSPTFTNVTATNATLVNGSTASGVGGGLIALEGDVTADATGAVDNTVTITSSIYISGLLVLKPVVPAIPVDQDAYRFYNDDGSDTAQTPKAAQDTEIALPDSAAFMLRIGVQATAAGTAASQTYRLEYQKNSGAWVTVGASTTNVRYKTSTNIIQSATGVTTSRLTGFTGTFNAGPSNEGGAPSIYNLDNSLGYTEFLLSLQLQAADLVPGDSLLFRLVAVSAGTAITPVVHPKVTVAASGALGNIVAVSPFITGGGSIEFVGSYGAPVGSTDTSFSFGSLLAENGLSPLVVEGDVVIVTAGRRATADTALAITTAGYSPIFSNVYSDGPTDDANLIGYYKFMGASPDNEVTITTTGFSNTGAAAVHVLRGVDPVDPWDSFTPTGYGEFGPASPWPGGVTPNTPYAWIMAMGAGAGATGGTTLTALTNPPNMSAVANHFKGGHNDRATVGAALYKGWTSGEFVPDPFGGGSTDISGSVVAIAFAIKPLSSVVVATGGSGGGGTPGDASGTLGGTVTITAMGGSATGAVQQNINVAENAALNYPTGLSGGTTITGGADAAQFTIFDDLDFDTAYLRWSGTNARDYEAPADANGNNVYEVTYNNGTITNAFVTVTNVVGAADGEASGTLSGVTVTPLASTATGGATKTVALTGVTVTAMAASATVSSSADTSGALVGVTVTPFASTVTSGVNKTVALSTTTVTALAATASGGVTKTVALTGVTVTTLTATATGGASRTVALPGPVTVTAMGAGGDPHFANVKLLLGFNGTDGSQTFVDESPVGRTMAATAQAQIDTATSAFGTGSALFDGVSDAITCADSADWHFGNQPFTLELRIRPSNITAGTRQLMGQWQNAPNLGWIFQQNGDRIQFNWSTTGSDTPTSVSGPGLVSNVWQHVGIDYDGAKFRAYIGGAMVGSLAATPTLFNSTYALSLGASDLLDFDYIGWMDEVRITKGVARYGSDAGFTPSTEAFPRSAGALNMATGNAAVTVALSTTTVTALTATTTGVANTTTALSTTTITPLGTAASGAAAATASLIPATVTALAGTATGTATKSVALGTITLSPMAASASGTVVAHGNATAVLQSVAASPLTATSTGTATKSAALSTTTLTALAAAATGGTAASTAPALATTTVTTLTNAASGTATRTVALGTVTASPLAATATGGAAKSVALGTVTTTSLLATAMGNASRSPTFALVTVTGLTAAATGIRNISLAPALSGVTVTPLAVSASAQGNSNVNVVFPTITLSALGGIGMGNASRAPALGTTTITPMGASANAGAGGVVTPPLSSVTVSPLSAIGTASSNKTVALTGVTVSVLTVAATGGAAKSVALGTVTASPLAATATGAAAKSVALSTTTITPLSGVVSVSNSVSISFAGVTVSALTTAVSAGSNKVAVFGPAVTTLPYTVSALGGGSINISPLLAGVITSSMGTVASGGASRTPAMPSIMITAPNAVAAGMAQAIGALNNNNLTVTRQTGSASGGANLWSWMPEPTPVTPLGGSGTGQAAAGGVLTLVNTAPLVSTATGAANISSSLVSLTVTSLNAIAEAAAYGLFTITVRDRRGFTSSIGPFGITG